MGVKIAVLVDDEGMYYYSVSSMASKTIPEPYQTQMRELMEKINVS